MSGSYCQVRSQGFPKESVHSSISKRFQRCLRFKHASFLGIRAGWLPPWWIEQLKLCKLPDLESHNLGIAAGASAGERHTIFFGTTDRSRERLGRLCGFYGQQVREGHVSQQRCAVRVIQGDQVCALSIPIYPTHKEGSRDTNDRHALSHFWNQHSHSTIRVEGLLHN
jgi:hypothetical protein